MPRNATSGPRYAANPGLTPSFRRSLPETGCLSQGLPYGKCLAQPCPPKTAKHPGSRAGNEFRRETGYIESWENRGGARWLLALPSCWRSPELSSSPPGPAGTRARSAPKMSPSMVGCRSHLSPIPTTSPPPCCFKRSGFLRGSRMIGDPFAISLTT